MKSSDVPSEKTTETLFVSNAFHYLRVKYPDLHVSLFAPSQIDEDEYGYDAKFLGAMFAFEAVLQFKKPKLDANLFTINPSHTPYDKHGRTQHEVLRDYPKRTAFYVAPTFRDYAGLNKKQLLNSEEFLDNYVVVDVSRLFSNTTRINYEAKSTGYPTRVRHLETSKRDKDAQALNDPRDWIKGRDLFKFFIAGNVRKPSKGPLQFANEVSPKMVVGDLVRFNDESGRGVRRYSSEILAERDYSQLINDSDGDGPYANRVNRNLRLGTSESTSSESITHFLHNF